jgi:hypothetical protein
MTALPGWTDDANALASNLDSIAFGGAYAIPYILDATTTAAGDPGNGKMRLSSLAPQSASTVLYLDLASVGGTDVTALLNSFGDSTSTIKGTIRLVKQGDLSRWAVFGVTSVTQLSGFRSVFVTPVQASHTNPFVDGDAIMLLFQRSGDIGGNGTLNRRTVSVVSNTAPSPTVSNTDLYEITALAGPIVLGVPTGTPTNGQSLMYRIKDNGTARTIAYNAAYRAPTEQPFPSSTIAGKWTYLGFIYNATDAKWDLLSSISNM